MKPTRALLCALCVLCLLVSLCAPAALAAESPLQYVVLGDSIGYGAGVLNPDEACYGRIVADTNGYAYQNHAVSGNRTDHLLRHLKRPEVAAAVKQADVISISIGGNDYLTDNVTGLVLDATLCNDYSRMDRITAQLKENFAAIIETIRSLNPDAAILMQTLYNPGTGINKAPYQAAVNRLNDLIRAYLAAHPGAFTIVDVAAAFGTDRSYIAQDSIHPSARGNERIAQVILRALRQLGLGEKTEPVVLHKGVDQSDRSLAALPLRLQMFRYLFSLLRVYRTMPE